MEHRPLHLQGTHAVDSVLKVRPIQHQQQAPERLVSALTVCQQSLQQRLPCLLQMAVVLDSITANSSNLTS